MTPYAQAGRQRAPGRAPAGESSCQAPVDLTDQVSSKRPLAVKPWLTKGRWLAPSSAKPAP